MGLHLISSGTVRKRGILLLDLLTPLLLTLGITESYLLPLVVWLWASNSHQQQYGRFCLLLFCDIRRKTAEYSLKDDVYAFHM